MSSQKKDKEYFVNGTVTQRGLLAYLNKEMSAEELERCEKLLKDDPFAAEALEGLQAAHAKAAVSLSALNKKVRERAGISEKKPLQIHWANYAWAAVLFGLMIGVGIVMVNFMGKQHEPVAQNPATSETSEPPIITGNQEGTITYDSVFSAPSSTTLATTTSAADSTQLREPINAIQFPSTEERKTEMKNTGTDASTITTSGNSISETDVKAAVSQGLTAERMFMPDSFKTTMSKRQDYSKSETNNVYGFTTEVTQQKVVRGAVVETDDVERVTLVTLDDAMKNFNSRNYEQASKQFEAILTEQPANIEALYYGGISDYINGYDKKSEKKFDRLLKEGSKYVDGSKWYKANLLLKRGKKEDALKLLNELSDSNSSYKERAIKKKAEIKF